MNEASILEQLQHLKGLTIRVGSIHEAQALQLRNWLLLIPGVQKGAAHVDTERKMVTFECKAKNFRKIPTVEDFCKNIQVWTRTILWDDTVVVVTVNKDIIYDSRNVKKPRK